MSFGSSKLGGTTQSHREFLASCVKLLLLWVAASDGQVDESELSFASSQFADTTGTDSTEDLLAIIRKSDLLSLEKAIRALARESRELRTAFLDLAITMSMADHRIAITENHILRFYADALHLGIDLLQRRFLAITGIAFSEPGDPGSPAWWEQIELQGGLERAEFEAAPAGGMSEAQARAVLGLAPDASADEIRRAYQDLGALFQPDRVRMMGDAAVAVASERLNRIEQAYKVLHRS